MKTDHLFTIGMVLMVIFILGMIITAVVVSMHDVRECKELGGILADGLCFDKNVVLNK